MGWCRGMLERLGVCFSAMVQEAAEAEEVVRETVKREIAVAMEQCPARRLCLRYRLDYLEGEGRRASDARPPAGALVLYPTGKYDEWDIGEYVGADALRPIFHRVKPFTPGRQEVTVGEIRPVTDRFKVW